MSKESFVSGSLHRISGQISEAANRIHNPEEPASVNFPQETQTPKNVSAPVDFTAKNAYLKPRYEELLRMKRDLTGQLHEAEARFSSEKSRFENLAAERNRTLNELRTTLTRLESCRIPNLDDPDFQTALNEALRSFENGRIELIRATSTAESGAVNTLAQQQAAGVDISSLQTTDLIKKGFAFFLPLILTIIFSSLFLALSFIIAWKVAL